MGSRFSCGKSPQRIWRTGPLRPARIVLRVPPVAAAVARARCRQVRDENAVFSMGPEFAAREIPSALGLAGPWPTCATPNWPDFVNGPAFSYLACLGRGPLRLFAVDFSARDDN